eukprot:7376452-Prymnesium_polylepis.1
MLHAVYEGACTFAAKLHEGKSCTPRRHIAHAQPASLKATPQWATAKALAKVTGTRLAALPQA